MIRLQFIAERTFNSAMIRWFSAGQLSHVDALAEDAPKLLGARFDAVGDAARGVHWRPQGYAAFSRRVVATIPADAAAVATFWSFLLAQLGKPYDWRAIAAFLVNRNWRRQDSWICSELQARALEVAGVVPRLYLAANKITPVALALAVSALPGGIFEEKST